MLNVIELTELALYRLVKTSEDCLLGGTACNIINPFYVTLLVVNIQNLLKETFHSVTYMYCT